MMVATDRPERADPQRHDPHGSRPPKSEGRGSQIATIGLVPAAGRAERLGSLPCSKEVLPVGIEADGRLRVAADDLLDAFATAGVTRAYVVLRPGKWDVAARLGSGSDHGLALGYLLTEDSRGVPDTLATAEPFVQGARVAIGFPDILFRPHDAFVRLGERLDRQGGGAVLGLLPTDAPERSDTVEIDASGAVRRIEIKADPGASGHAWVLALWDPAFTRFLGAYVRNLADGPERQLGHVLKAWLAAGHPLSGVLLDGDGFHDIGTAAAYARRFAPEGG
jgi:glucose-1-phosphate thymidylyltransferase